LAGQLLLAGSPAWLVDRTVLLCALPGRCFSAATAAAAMVIDARRDVGRRGLSVVRPGKRDAGAATNPSADLPLCSSGSRRERAGRAAEWSKSALRFGPAGFAAGGHTSHFVGALVARHHACGCDRHLACR